ncbi:MAG: cytochrome c biogenesis protein CcdA [Lentisphaeria bacterium]
MRNHFTIILLTVLFLCNFHPSFAPFAKAQKAGVQSPRVTARASVNQIPTQAEPLIVAVTMTIPPGQHVYAEKDRFFELTTKSKKHIGEVRIKTPALDTIEDQFGPPGDKKAEVFAQTNNTFTVTAPIAGNAGDEWAITLAISWQACSDTVCFPPTGEDFSFSGIIGEGRRGNTRTERTPNNSAAAAGAGNKGWQQLAEKYSISASTTGYHKPESFLTFLKRGSTGQASTGFFAKLGDKPLWLTIGIILLGGLLLNLTPCVLPMIPVNLAIIGAGAQAGSKSRGLTLGLVYGLGIALAYGTLGLIVVLTGKAFGTINANPWFNLTIAILFGVLALAVLGVFNIDLSRLGAKLHTEKWKTGSLAVAFIMGGVSALLAGACVAPIVIAVLILAADQYAEGSRLALLYPFLLGIGMALPWPFAGAGLSFLPKPGKWMNYIKYVFGLFILALAAYYAYTAYNLFSPNESAEPPPAAAEATAGNLSTEKLQWYSDLEPALRTGLKQGKPVMIDFWASWCKNCHAMDKTTLRHAEVRKELKKFVLLKYQAEDLDSARHKPVIKHFGVMGLPTYVILTLED